MLLETSRTIVRNLDAGIDDLTNYLSWLQNPQEIPFIDSANSAYRESELVEYLRTIEKSETSFQAGIFMKPNLVHVGNVKFHDINLNDLSCWVGFLIGEKEARGIGLAKEVFQAIFSMLNNWWGIRTVFLGVHPENLPALTAYKKMGFEEYSQDEKKSKIIMRLYLP